MGQTSCKILFKHYYHYNLRVPLIVTIIHFPSIFCFAVGSKYLFSLFFTAINKVPSYLTLNPGEDAW